MNSEFQKFVPFTKVDEVKQEVWGIVTAEVPDKSGEICNYEKTKPYYKAWSEEFEKATDGKSCGNLRYMHSMRVVGKGVGIEFRDADKEIVMGFKVTDRDAWRDVEEGVLTGFSQGGKYVQGPDIHKHYTANPSEVSLVDNPCLGVSHFAFIKANGTVEMRKNRTEELPNKTEVGEIVKTAETESNPALTKDDVKNLLQEAVADLKVSLAPSIVEKAVDDTVAAHSAVAAESTGVAESTPPALSPETLQKAQEIVTSLQGQLNKGLSDVAQFAQLLQELNWLQRMAEYEAASEGDASPVPAALLEQIKGLVTTFLSMAEEEAGELVTRPDDGADSKLNFAYASQADVRQTSKLLEAATRPGLTLKQSYVKQAGEPAPKGEQAMADLAKKAGLMDHLKKAKEMADDHHEKLSAHLDKCMDAMGGDGEGMSGDKDKGAEKTVASTDLSKSTESRVDEMLKGFSDKFSTLIEQMGTQLEAPKAAQTSGARVVTKGQDNQGGTAVAELEEEGEPVFKAQGVTSYQVTDEYRQAMSKVRGTPLDQ